MFKWKHKYNYLFAVLGFLFLFSCNNTDDKEEGKKSVKADNMVNELSNNKKIEYQSDTAKEIIESIYKTSDSLNASIDLSIDTLSLGVFWRIFQNNIRTSNKKDVLDVLEFPIHAIYLVTFQFSYDCDTAKFIRNEKKYLRVDIDKSNVHQHYNLLFSRILKEMILHTSVKDLLGKRLDTSENEIAYPFFVRDYVPNGSCYFDHHIYFHFLQINKNWRIAISGD